MEQAVVEAAGPTKIQFEIRQNGEWLEYHAWQKEGFFRFQQCYAKALVGDSDDHWVTLQDLKNRGEAAVRERFRPATVIESGELTI